MEKSKYPNKTIRLLYERASCRSFSDKKIEPEVLRYILESGIHAPTGGNLQPYSIIKIEKNETKERLAELCEGQQFIADAPVDLLFCIDLHRLERWTELETAPFTARNSFRHFWIAFQDTVICAQSISTAAESLGLGSVFIGSVMEGLREIKKMFHLPEGVFPVVLLSLGYPKKNLSPRNKLGVPATVHEEVYHEMEDQTLREAFNEKYADREFKITEKQLKKIKIVCRDAHGEEFAEKCAKEIEKRGYINMAQYYFGLHYRANEMARGNATFLKILEEYGFSWFKG
ncbi:MAG: nitroreductase family protein [Euryarchaeota archaeon]|nr:nitroreductase family protein [Euryarchaeota archaeon]